MQKFNLKIKTLILILLCTGFASNIQAQWIQRGSDIDGEAGGDNLGWSVSFSSDGNTLAIGAINNDGNGNASGHVRVYNWNGTAWIQRGNDIDGEATNDESGYSVSLSSDGNTLAIGATGNDRNGSNAGHVRVYAWNGTAWIQRGNDIDGEDGGDQSGRSVFLSSDGNTLAIGAPFNDGNGSNSGHVRVYAWNGTAWTQRGSDIDGEAGADQSGISVYLSSDGNTLAAGAIGNDATGVSAGHVRVYTWDGTAWIQRGNDIDGEALNDFSGTSVSLSSDGNTLAVGAIFNDGTDFNAGHVRVYTWDGTAWIQRGNDIDGEAGDDLSGNSISLSSDGNTLAIGAPNNDGNGDSSGHVRVYTWNGTAWTQRGSDIDGEAAYDNSGFPISLSSDGNTLAIGAVLNGGTAPGAGHVRVYVFPVPEINLKQGTDDIASGGEYDFQNIEVNASSADITFTIENTGTADLELSGTAGSFVVLGGTNADQFSITQTGIASPIAAGSSQDFTVQFSPTSVGEKTATLTITNNDEDEGTYIINLKGGNIVTSLSDLENESIKVYPNPTEDKVIIENLPVGKTAFILSNVMGNPVITGEAEESLELDLSALPTGVYILTLNTNKGSSTRKIIKN